MSYKYKGDIYLPFEMLRDETLYYMLSDLADVDGVPKKPEAAVVVGLIEDELKKRRHGSDDK